MAERDRNGFSTCVDPSKPSSRFALAGPLWLQRVICLWFVQSLSSSTTGACAAWRFTLRYQWISALSVPRYLHKSPTAFQWGLCICISEVVSLPLTEGKGVWGLLGPCLRNWASEIFTGVGKVRGRVLMALDAPVVGEEAMWISTSRCRHLSACIVKMRPLFKRSS